MSEHPKNEPFDPTESPSERLRAATARYKAHNDGIEKKQSEPPVFGSLAQQLNQQLNQRSDRFRQETLDAARLKLRGLQHAIRTNRESMHEGHLIELIDLVDVILTWGVP